MSQGCPISVSQINEKAARLSSLTVFIAILIFLLTAEKWIIFFLAFDFFLRAFLKKNLSPLCRLSGLVLESLKIKPVMINEGPKRFAARIGFVFCFLISIFILLSFSPWIINVMAGFILVCAFLEAFFRYCLGCKMYFLLQGGFNERA